MSERASIQLIVVHGSGCRMRPIVGKREECNCGGTHLEEFLGDWGGVLIEEGNVTISDALGTFTIYKRAP